MAQAIALVDDRQETSRHHDEATQPNEPHERLVINSDTPGLLINRIAQGYIKVSGKARANGRFSHIVALDFVNAFLRSQHGLF